MKIKLILIFLIVPFLLSSCSKEDAKNVQRLPNRTVLFYMAGDNDLAGETQEKIDSLAKNWNIAGNNHLLVYQDRGGEYSPRLLEIKSKGQIEVIKEYALKENSASSFVFSRVLNDMVEFCPNSDYGLVMFSHGSGWLPEGFSSSSTRSVAMDGREEFDLKDFARSIPLGQFRFIIFESCLMAGAEVAYELMGKTDYVLASSSEILSPGFTPLYRKMIPLIYDYAPQLEKFAAAYFNYYNNLSGNMRSATVSVIRPSELKPLNKLLTQVEKRIEYWGNVDRDRIQAFDRHSPHLFYDLESYVQEVGTSQEKVSLANILQKSILYQASTENFLTSTTGGFSIKKHCGLTIYIPVVSFTETEKYKDLNKKWKSLLLFSENNNN